MIGALRITPDGYHTGAPPITVILLVLLAGVLILIEAMRAYDEPGSRTVRRELILAGAPLLAGSVAIVALRLVPLLN